MPSPLRFLGLVALAGLCVLAPESAHASGAVLPPTASLEPSTLDVTTAIAVTPFGATRWSRLTVGGPTSVLWLVPARPGASLDWASEAWLSALEDASSPRVRPPSANAPCGMPTAPERVAAWGASGSPTFPRAVVVHATEAALRGHAAARGFDVSSAAATKIRDTYAKGYALVSVELDTSGGPSVSSPTLRISDDGGAIVPLALTGSAQTSVRVTAMVLAPQSMTLAGATELRGPSLTWGASRSNFAGLRANLLVAGGGGAWLRESTSHGVLFDGVPVVGWEPIQPLVTTYFREANGQPRPACEAAARTAATASGAVGRACAAGALARVPGGVACTSTAAAIDPSAFACGTGIDDLALALAGTSPSAAVLTRFTGLVPKGGFGMDAAITGATSDVNPVVDAAAYEPCPAAATPPGGASARPVAPPLQAGGARPTHTVQTSGCTGSTTMLVYEDTGEEDVIAEEGCGGSTAGTSTSTGSADGESCSGSTTGSSTSTSSSASGSGSSSSSSGASSGSSGGSGAAGSSSSSGGSSTSGSSSSSGSSGSTDNGSSGSSTSGSSSSSGSSGSTDNGSSGSSTSGSSSSSGSSGSTDNGSTSSSSSGSTDNGSTSSSSSGSTDNGSTSSSSSSGWDKTDSSSTSDGCFSSTSSSSSSSSGDPAPTAASPASMRLHSGAALAPTRAARAAKRPPSPVSRAALLLVAIVLPVRRRWRLRKL